MVITLKIEDKLEGETNFRAWKARILLLLEENDLKEYVEVWFQVPLICMNWQLIRRRK
jgi:hypothetical protein